MHTPASTVVVHKMSPETRALLPLLAVFAAVLDGTTVLALGLRLYTGVAAFASLFVFIGPGLYVLAERAQPVDVDTLAPGGDAVGYRQR